MNANTNQPITWQQLNESRHVDMVKTNCKCSNWASDWVLCKHHSILSVVGDHVHPFMTTLKHLLKVTSSGIILLVTLDTSQAGFLNMTVSSLYSNILHSHQISIPQSTFWMWWNRTLASQMCSQQICSDVMLSVSVETKISDSAQLR